MMRKVSAGILGLALAAGLCFTPNMTAAVQGAPQGTGAAEIEQEDRDMEEQLRMETDLEVPEENFDMKTEDTDGEEPDVSGAFSQEQETFLGERQPEDIFTEGNDGALAADEFSDETEEFSEEDAVLFSDAPEGQDAEEDVSPHATEVTLPAEEGTDITGILNSLLSSLRYQASDENPYKVIIPPGNYQLTGTICMYSNFHLYAEGAVITKTSPSKHLLLRLGNTEESAGGYDGYRNITIEGGTWDSNYMCCDNKEMPGGFVGFRIGHASHVTVKNATFLNNLKSHFLEFAGVKDAKVTGCTFRGYWEPYEGGGQECIQIDACKDNIFPNYAPFDGAVCEDILIDHNTFEDVFAGVGSHSMMFGSPYKNITITDNTFRNIKKRAVWCLNYQDCLVSGNVMENVGAGVYVRSVYSGNTHVMEGQPVDNTMNQETENVVVANNRITLAAPCKIGTSLWRSFAVQIIGEKTANSPQGIPDGNYIIKGVTVKDNTISGPGNGIRLHLASDCEITGNTVTLENAKKFANRGIYLGASSRNAVKGNAVAAARSSGIYVYNGGASLKISSTDNVITENKVTDGYADGILVDSTSNRTALVANNCRKNKGRGISVIRSILTSLSGNTAQSNQGNGIYAYHSNIKAQRANVLQGNGAAYAMYMIRCTGNAQSLKNIKADKATPKVIKLTGTAAGGKAITVTLKKNSAKLGNGRINAKGRYTVPIKAQKKGITLVLSVTDKYKNCITAEQKVK